jgi:hypothetical protein
MASRDGLETAAGSSFPAGQVMSRLSPKLPSAGVSGAPDAGLAGNAHPTPALAMSGLIVARFWDAYTPRTCVLAQAVYRLRNHRANEAFHVSVARMGE